MRVDWAPASAQQGVYYRLYDADGKLTNGDQEATEIIAPGTIGQIYTWTVRSATFGGFLSPAATIRFKDGYGIVDASGALVKDTVKPAAVTSLRATVAGANVVLRWPKVADPIGLRGYRVVSGQPPRVAVGTTASFPRARVRGKIASVAAVDRSGNFGAAAMVRIR